MNEFNRWECTGDRLKLWEKELKEYEQMTKEEQQKYLISLDNRNKFLEWHNSENKLVCNWSEGEPPTKVPIYSIKIPDPMVVGKIEKSLGRELTEEELEEGYIFFRIKLTEGKYRYITYEPNKKEEWEEFIVPRVRFPDEI